MADAPVNNSNQAPAPKKGGYGKRPLWQWILLYVIIGGVIYYGIYYYYTHRKSSSTNGSGTTNTSIY